MKKLLVVFMLLLIGVIAGCGQGSEYEGKWVGIEKSQWDGTKFLDRMEIKKNGENYLITVGTETYKDTGKTIGEMGKKAAWNVGATTNVSATLKDGKLMVNPSVGLTFVKSDGTILGADGTIFKKETDEEVNRIKEEITKTFKEKYPKMSVEN